MISDAARETARQTARETARVSYLITGVLLILLALFTVMARVGLPLAAGYKSHMESRVSDYLRSPVHIGELSLRWEGFGPLLRARDVTLFETTERVVTLDEIVIDINLAKSLMRGIPIINELSLVGASLVVEADGDGQISLHGMESMRSATTTEDRVKATQGSSDGVDVIAWLFNARKVGLLDAQLTLLDMKNDSQVVFTNLNVRAENDGDLHKLRVDADLPDALGGRRLEAGIDVFGNPRKLSETDGNVYLSAETVDIRRLTELLGLGGLSVKGLPQSVEVDALASAELWGKWIDGQFVSARGPIEIGSVTNPVSNELIFDSASGHLKLLRFGESIDIQVTDIQTTLGAATLNMEELRISKLVSEPLPLSPEAAGTVEDATQPLTHAQDADATWDVSVLASEVPAELAVRFTALALSVSRPALAKSVFNSTSSGSVRNLALSVADAGNKPSIGLSADIDDLVFDGDNQLPSLGPLRGEVAVKDSVGQLTLSAQQMPFAWPAVSDEFLSVDSLQAVMDIDLRDSQRILLGADIQLADNGIDTSTRLRAVLSADASPHFDVQSRFSATDVTELKAWLPRKQLGETVADWIDNAITAGEASDGSLLLFGNVSDFPYEDGNGAFQASVNINDATLSFLPGWPAASNINGRMEMNGLALTGSAENSILDRFSVSRTQVAIPDLAAAVVELSTTASGRFQDILDFGINGPLKGFLEPAIGDMSGTGFAEMDLKLSVPLTREPENSGIEPTINNWRPFAVNGSLFLKDNDVTFGRADLMLDDANGAVNFNELGISINNIAGRLLGHSVRLSGATEGQGDAANTRVTIKGALEANDLLAHYGDPLDQFIRGASQWTATISAPHSAERFLAEGVTLDVRSDLVGAELLLPVPFNKGTATARDFSLTTAFRDPSMDQFWEARYGDELTATVRMVDQSLYSLLVELGQTESGNTSASLGEPGIRLQGKVDRLAADGWVETVAQYINSLPQSEGEPELILPISARLDTDALILGKRSMGEAALQANTDDTYLNFAVSNQALKGNMRYPRKHWEKDTALKARLDLLDWSVIDALSEEAEPETGNFGNSDELDPRLLPPVEARVSALVKDNIRIRDLVVHAKPNVSGLDITTLGFAYETMRMVGQGHWYLRDPQSVSSSLTGKHTTQLNVVLQSDDFGVGLDEIGLSGIIDDAQGSIEMKLDWPGPIYKPDFASLDGDIKIDMNAGSIVPLEPGAGRMVGLFAFQALPRRLNLDFKDMTGAGLAFENIAGSIVIDDGIAQVPLLQLTGPIGVVDIIGSSNLNTQQFDQQVTILPRVSAALPIIGAISGGASAGIGALVAAGFLKALGVDFDRIGLRTYRLTGDWLQPEFTSVPSDYLKRRQ
ncbi:MAG: YhdP family protein [Granulosicoccus sp.]